MRTHALQSLPFDPQIFTDDCVHARPEKTINGLFRRVDDRFVLVERRVQDQRDVGPFPEGGNQRVVTRVGAATDTLKLNQSVSSCVIDPPVLLPELSRVGQ